MRGSFFVCSRWKVQNSQFSMTCAVPLLVVVAATMVFGVRLRAMAALRARL
jgi:hypothetical protein